MKKVMISDIKVFPVVLIQMYDGEAPDGRLMNASLVELIEIDPAVAVEKAKKLFPDRKFARVQQYIEKEVLK